MNLSWQLWAVLSAIFAALTAIFAKVGVEGVGADLATFIRTVVIILALGAMLRHRPMAVARLDRRPELSLSRAVRPRHRRLVALLLSGAATGRRGAGRADRQAERRHGRDLRRGLPRRDAVLAKLARHRADRGRGDAGRLSGLDGSRRPKRGGRNPGRSQLSAT